MRGWGQSLRQRAFNGKRERGRRRRRLARRARPRARDSPPSAESSRAPPHL